jgi:hypothetical protein
VSLVSHISMQEEDTGEAMQHKRLRNVVDDDGGVGPAKQVYSLTCAFAHPSAHSRHPSIQPASHLERLCNTGEAMQRKHKRQHTSASGEQVHSFINALGGWVDGWVGGWMGGWVDGSYCAVMLDVFAGQR